MMKRDAGEGVGDQFNAYDKRRKVDTMQPTERRPN